LARAKEKTRTGGGFGGFWRAYGKGSNGLTKEDKRRACTAAMREKEKEEEEEEKQRDCTLWARPWAAWACPEEGCALRWLRPTFFERQVRHF